MALIAPRGVYIFGSYLYPCMFGNPDFYFFYPFFYFFLRCLCPCLIWDPGRPQTISLVGHSADCQIFFNRRQNVKTVFVWTWTKEYKMYYYKDWGEYFKLFEKDVCSHKVITELFKSKGRIDGAAKKSSLPNANWRINGSQYRQYLHNWDSSICINDIRSTVNTYTIGWIVLI